MNASTIIFDSPVPAWLVCAAALAAGAGVIVFARRDVARLGPRLRALIISLAAVGVAMLAGLMLNPKLIRTRPDPEKPRCTLLVDSSRSMLIAEPCSDALAKLLPPRKQKTRLSSKDGMVSREEVVRALLGPTGGEWLTMLKGNFDVTAHRFDSKLAGLSLDGAAPFAVNAEGYSTSLGGALEQAAGGSAGQRPRAVVLISDGAWNDGPDPAEIARALGRLGTPVVAVGIGDPNPPRDAAVTRLAGPKSALLGDELSLVAQIVTSGMPATSMAVQLLEDGEVVKEKQVTVPAAGRPVSIAFSYVPEKPGRKHFTARIQKQQGEQDQSNNEAGAAVEVGERTINVLLVDGEPRWEFRFIRNVLERDPAVRLSVCLIRPKLGTIAGPGYVSTLPADKKDLAEYDLVILGEVPRAGLPDSFLTELAEMVKLRGGALIVIAGRRGYYRDLAGTPVEEVLPVKLDGVPDAGRGGSAFRMELSHEGGTHLVTRLASDQQENELTWAALPAMTWSAGGASLTRGADALLVHPYMVDGTARAPLVAVQRAGAGKVMFCGVEETWRWRKAVGDRYHYRFWAQAVRWMVKRPFAQGDARARLSVDRSECGIGESVEIEAFCVGPDGFPLAKAQVWVKAAGPGKEFRRLVMEPAPGGWGIYRAAFAPERPGTYRLQPIVSAYGDEPLESSATLEATRPDLERNFLAQDRATLEAIAQAAGGQYLAAEQIDRLPGILAAKAERKMLVSEYSPCRHWAYFSFLTTVLGAAWLIRKRSGLA